MSEKNNKKSPKSKLLTEETMNKILKDHIKNNHIFDNYDNDSDDDYEPGDDYRFTNTHNVFLVPDSDDDDKILDKDLSTESPFDILAEYDSDDDPNFNSTISKKIDIKTT